MRCQFCGWDNSQGRETCEKCNKPLMNSGLNDAASSIVNHDNHDRPTNRQINEPFNPKATVCERSLSGMTGNDAKECPKCGYPLENGECSACGYKENEEKPEPAKVISEVRKTVRPTRKDDKDGKFMLVPISEENGMPEGDALSYEGNAVILNRDNTDPKNATITSLEQACITLENGKWSIEDRSEYKTTFVEASRKIELQKGDLLLLGNQLYRFEL